MGVLHPASAGQPGRGNQAVLRPLPRLLPRPDAIVRNVLGPLPADVKGFTAVPDEILPLCDTRVVAVGRHDGRGANSPVRARFVHIWTWKLAEAEAVVYGLDLPVTDLPITISAEARLMRGRYRACSNGLGLAAGRAIASPR